MNYIRYKTQTKKHKPNLYNQEVACPFCDRESLKLQDRIIKETSDYLIVGNKYPVMDDALQTVIIEHKQCEEHIGSYSLEYLTGLLEFSLDYYDELNESGEYQSVCWFKNYGSYSGGSVPHSHMQIIAFEHNDYLDQISEKDFVGEVVWSIDDILEVNISHRPRSEFYEFNFLLKRRDRLDVLANYLQKTVRFVLEDLNTEFRSYNLAFFVEENGLKVKLLPRKIVNLMPLVFGLHFVPDNIPEVSQRLRDYKN